MINRSPAPNAGPETGANPPLLALRIRAVRRVTDKVGHDSYRPFRTLLRKASMPPIHHDQHWRLEGLGAAIL